MALVKYLLYVNSLRVMYRVIGVWLPGIKFRPYSLLGIGAWATYLPLCISVSPFMRMRLMPIFYGCGESIK